MKWHRGEYQIAVNPRAINVDETGRRTGYIRGPFGISSRAWDITHIPSGHRISSSASTLKEAKAIVDKLLPMADWAQADPLASLGDAGRRQVLAITWARP